MTESVINYELLDFTMKYIKTNPERHNQDLWMEGEIEIESGTHVADMNVCGTTACFAGWASIFAGWHQLRPHQACIDCHSTHDEQTSDELCKSVGCDYGMRYDLVVDETGNVTTMDKAAEQSLGLRRDQAKSMFAGCNTRSDLDAMIVRLHDNPAAEI